MSFDPTERQVSEDVERSMDLFQRARVGTPAPLEPRSPQRILLVLDGSPQDDTSVDLARRLTQQHDARLAVLDAREFGEEASLAPRVAEQLGADCCSRRTGSAFEQILAEAAQRGSDLIIVPCPFGRELADVGPDSAGTVIDVLLARSPVPLLVVRRPFPVSEPLFPEILLLLSRENNAASLAGGWALGLIAARGRIRLLLVVEQSLFEQVREVLQRVDPQVRVSPADLEAAMSNLFARLHRRLAQGATERGMKYELVVEREEQPTLRWDDGSQPALLALALERSDPTSQPRVQDRIRHSPHPVLVVPRDAPGE